MANRAQSSSSSHPGWEAFRRNFTQSNYITDFWNWLMTLMSKGAEMVLFGTVLYSGYQLYPGVPHIPPAIDAVVFVIQQAALDIGGMGLFKLAKRAKLPNDSFPVRLGVALVVLMIVNVALASIKHTLPMIPEGVFVGIETLLLIARAVVAVLFGHAIHALREEYGESTITVKEASELLQHITESEQRVTEHIERTANNLSAHFTEHIERTLSEQPTRTELANLTEIVQAHAHLLAELAALPGLFEQLEQTIHEQVRTVVQQEVRAVMEADTEQRRLPVPNTSRPKLSIVEANTEQQRTPKANTTATDKGTFVRRCLTETPDIRNNDIQRKAREEGITISPAHISEVRKAFSTGSQSAETNKRTDPLPLRSR